MLKHTMWLLKIRFDTPHGFFFLIAVYCCLCYCLFSQWLFWASSIGLCSLSWVPTKVAVQFDWCWANDFTEISFNTLNFILCLPRGCLCWDTPSITPNGSLQLCLGLPFLFVQCLKSIYRWEITAFSSLLGHKHSPEHELSDSWIYQNHKNHHKAYCSYSDSVINI